MTDEPLPLPIPPSLDYLSVAPYFISFEWLAPVPNVQTYAFQTLAVALSMCYHPSAPIGSPFGPRRRAVIDGRGVTVWGWIESAHMNPSARSVGTFEVLALLRAMDLSESTLAELDRIEMEMLWATS